MTHCLRQLEAVFDATTIISPTRFTWFGEPSPALSRKILRALDPDHARGHLVSQLRQRLYAAFYVCGFPQPQASTSAFPAGCPSFTDALSRANAGTGSWTMDWLVSSVDGDDMVAERDGLRLRAGAGSWKISADRQPGQIVRVYFNVTASGALSLMAELTRELNRLPIYFRFKVIAHPERFTRCDSAVLYLRADDFARAAEPVARAHSAACDGARSAVPAFTKRLAGGLGLAEDPAQGTSFGWHRSGLLAEAILDAHERGLRALEARLGCVKARFAEAGLNLDAPYLNPGAVDRYELDWSANSSRPPARSTHDMRESHDADKEQALALALAIGTRLADAALWHDGRCTWFGPVRARDACEDAADVRHRSTLGPSLYDGTSGIGLFLAELASASGDKALEAASLGAARQALHRLPAHPAASGPGLYSGWPGVALAVARIGRLAGDRQLVIEARKLVTTMAHGAPHSHDFDLISGRAGGVLALVSLARMLGETGYLETAQGLADSLCGDAEASSEGWSWRGPGQRHGRNLTGYSHGTAGVAHALLELFAETRNDRLLTAARQAFAYERHWFAPARRNWPDFRVEHKLPAGGRAPPLFQTAWCHGAPGIALSRLRACALLNDGECRAEAVVALDTTARATESLVASGEFAASLCHGVTGNLQILEHGFEQLGSTEPQAKLARQATARMLREAHVRVSSGLDQGELTAEPGLMLGSAGLGFFLLRSARPETPSALWVS
jgi:hypothetical protein